MKNFYDFQNVVAFQELFHKVVQSFLFFFLTKASIQQKIL